MVLCAASNTAPSFNELGDWTVSPANGRGVRGTLVSIILSKSVILSSAMSNSSLKLPRSILLTLPVECSVSIKSLVNCQLQ